MHNVIGLLVVGERGMKEIFHVFLNECHWKSCRELRAKNINKNIGGLGRV